MKNVRQMRLTPAWTMSSTASKATYSIGGHITPGRNQNHIIIQDLLLSALLETYSGLADHNQHRLCSVNMGSGCLWKG